MPGTREEQRRGEGLQSISYHGAQLYFSQPLYKAMNVLVSESCLSTSVSRSFADLGKMREEGRIGRRDAACLIHEGDQCTDPRDPGVEEQSHRASC